MLARPHGPPRVKNELIFAAAIGAPNRLSGTYCTTPPKPGLLSQAPASQRPRPPIRIESERSGRLQNAALRCDAHTPNQRFESRISVQPSQPGIEVQEG